MQDLPLLLIAGYLRKLMNPEETDAETAAGITADLKRYRAYLSTLDKTEIEQ